MALSPLRTTLACVAVTLTSACVKWEDTRREIVTPLNQLVHVDYPLAMKSGDAEQVTRLFAPELVDWAAEDVREVVAPFSRIDHSRCVVYDSTPPDASGAVSTECVLRIDGVRSGERFTFEQARTLTARPTSGVDGAEWKIVGVETGYTAELHGGPVFVDEAAARGLNATNRSRGTPGRYGEVLTYVGSSGVAVGDVDGDGADDLLLLSGDRMRLFKNRDGQFEDVTEASGITTPDEGECRCAYFADIDNDGDQDLFAAMFLGEALLFENEGAGTFRRVPSSESGIVVTHGQTSSACFGDFDRDGDLDLVLANGNNIYVEHPEPERNGRNAYPDQYFENDGDGTFTDATRAAGLGETGWALACAVSDYDRDGDLDLFIANDLGLDLLYRNRGDGTFDEVAEGAGIVFPGSSMSADFGDLNGDGWPDLYVSGMASNSRWMLHQPGFPVPIAFPFSAMFRGFALEIMWQMFHGNRLYVNNRDGTFREVSKETRSDWLGWAWSAVFLDYDNDARLDIYCANGFWSGEETTDC
jgi:hypothetical protein